MAAYASSQRESVARGLSSPSPQRQLAGSEAAPESRPAAHTTVQSITDLAGASVIDLLLDRVAERIAATVIDRLGTDHGSDAEWLDSLHAAEYLGVHRDTLRKLAGERAIPSERDGPGCKLHFRRADLEAWRRSGGRPRHLSMTVAGAA